MFSKKLNNQNFPEQKNSSPSKDRLKSEGKNNYWHSYAQNESPHHNITMSKGFAQHETLSSLNSSGRQTLNNPFANSLKYFSSDTPNGLVFAGPIMEDNYEDKYFKEQLEIQVNYENPMLFLEDFEKIADGTTSTVCRAREIRTRVEVAVKRINLNLLKDKQLVINELSITKKLNHANIVQFVDSFLLETELWIVMEYMQAGTLADVVASSRMIEQQIATVSKRLLEALSYLHGMGIIHRDIKSDCVLIREDGEVKLSDFGFSIQLTPETPRRRSLVGTPYWMSPEIISRQPYNTAADIWSFGILVFEMVDGEPPYFNDIPPHAMRKIKEESVPVMANLSRVSPMLQGFVGKMIIKDPLNRLSASELLWHPFLKKADSNLCLLPLLKK